MDRPASQECFQHDGATEAFFFATRQIRTVAALLLSPRHRLEMGGNGPSSQCAPESLCGGKHKRLVDKLCVNTTLPRLYQQPQKLSFPKLPGKRACQGDNDGGLAWLKPLLEHDGPSLVVGEGV